MNNFTDALKQRNLEELRKHPKGRHTIICVVAGSLYQTDKKD